jgi:FMN-dependent NADH-azoreductase
MKSILVIRSGANHDASFSNKLTRELTAAIVAKYPDAVVTERDLAAHPLPHVTAPLLATFQGAPPDGDDQKAGLARSDQAVAELLGADIVILGAPMYNFGIPSTLKAWIDHITRVGKTFSYSAQGPKGLVAGKKLVLAVATGGVYSEGPMKQYDFVGPYLRGILGFLGLVDVSEVRVEGVALGPEAAARATAAASTRIAELVASL